MTAKTPPPSTARRRSSVWWTATRSGQLTASRQTMQSPLEKARNRESGARRHCRGGEKHPRDRRHEPSGTLDRAALCQRWHRGRHGGCAQKEKICREMIKKRGSLSMTAPLLTPKKCAARVLRTAHFALIKPAQMLQETTCFSSAERKDASMTCITRRSCAWVTSCVSSPAIALQTLR